MKLFEILFSKDSSGDGLTQEEREAIVDLLILGAYTDNRLSLREEESFEFLTGTFKWESATALSDYINTAIARVRSVQSNPAAKDGLLQEIKQRIQSKKTISKALNLLHQVFIADGRSWTEATFYREVESLLKH